MKQLIGLLIVLNGCASEDSTNTQTQDLCNNETSPCPCPGSPIIIDVAGDGVALTAWEEGIQFGLRPGTTGTLSWTAPDSDDAWLVLDRDGDGLIRDGSEMFGNFTEQPALSLPDEHRNGFRALAILDDNADRVVDAKDAGYAQLRLWQDRNHDGVSQAEELSSLPALGVAGLGVDYEATRLVDKHGNAFRYHGSVIPMTGYRTGMTAWDVWLTGTRPLELPGETHGNAPLSNHCHDDDPAQINLHPQSGTTIPAWPAAYQPFQVRWSECNSGSDFSGTYQTRVDLDGSIRDVSVSSIKNQCITKTISVPGYPPGSYFLRITSDIYDSAYELNEYDNVWQNYVTVQ